MDHSHNHLQCTIVGRRADRVVLACDVTRTRTVIQDRTGDVELLLELLAAGRTAAEAVTELTAHREGVQPAALWNALDNLHDLGLFGASHTVSAAVRLNPA